MDFFGYFQYCNHCTYFYHSPATSMKSLSENEQPSAAVFSYFIKCNMIKDMEILVK